MTGNLKCVRLAVACLLVLAVAAPAGICCPFCPAQGQTLSQEINQASLVIYGTLSNPQLTNPGAESEGTTDFAVEKIIKNHKFLEGKKTLTIHRYLPVEDKNVKFLIFCDVFKDKLDPYRGIPIKAEADLPRYLEGALKVKDAKVGQRLRFFFDYLDNEDAEIANDALKEFGNSDYKDYKEMAAGLPAGKIARWLEDPKTPAYRIGLYASMLGHSSKEPDKHGKLLRTLIDDPEKRVSSGVDGVLAGYVMLQPKDGWKHVHRLLKDEKQDFMMRYAALKAVRFLVDFRPDILATPVLFNGVAELLEHSDIADLAIEDLRKWKRWEFTARVLALAGKPSHNEIPIIRRAILRFAMQSPAQAAADYVKEQRKADETYVTEQEDLLKLEATPTPTTPADTKLEK